jgi:hypothetical protein
MVNWITFILIWGNLTQMDGYFNMSEKKIYLGYSPKAKNIEKLAKYVAEKKSMNVSKIHQKLNKGPLKNKRF